ncbi:NUDIX domain-containing protein [Pontibacter korlensis]|uniref:8-oxo-dGTP diphosphatase n=1 Tax=Pontibacter korlensis TaxID=400092 RepID=A0A0E3UXB0_9BACT|nr:NUDIX domain-containing protein [Pontibacter korlensis]AKD03446.1 DNA mismatch repair protein MutT [Pontibacter korlensis]
MKIIDKLAWIELKDGKILSTRSRGKNVYYIPGGKREAGETDQETLMREIEEELSIRLIPDSIEYVETFQAQAHGHAEGIEVKMQCYSARYKGTIKAASEIEEVVWLQYADRDKVSPVDKIIFDWLRNKGLLS